MNTGIPGIRRRKAGVARRAIFRRGRLRLFVGFACIAAGFILSLIAVIKN